MLVRATRELCLFVEETGARDAGRRSNKHGIRDVLMKLSDIELLRSTYVNLLNNGGKSTIGGA